MAGTRSGSTRRVAPSALAVDLLHPDFGLGGAEALMRDVVLALAGKGVPVRVFTSHYDPNRCFAETCSMDVRVFGSFLPRHLCRRCHIVFATARAAYCAFRATLAAGSGGDVVYVCDQISAYVLFLRLFTRRPVLFYCHFPDRLLVQHTNSPATLLGRLKRLYRVPFDALEEFTTGLADVILVNSNFTRGVFDGAFPKLHSAGVCPEVLYPVCNAAQGQFDPNICLSDAALETLLDSKDTTHPTFVSINRFERKKNIAVAIDALYQLREALDVGTGQDDFCSRRVRLVVAGGYDTKVHENVEYHDALYELAEGHGFRCYSPIRDGGDAADFDDFGVPKAAPHDAEVIFVPSFTDAQRSCLLAGCLAVLYTPDREHFGIVPLECMAAARPVIAVQSGGPMETVVHGKTGFLCPPDETLAVTIASHMRAFLQNPSAAKRMGTAGRERVLQNFSFESFQSSLSNHVGGLNRAALDGSLWQHRRGATIVRFLRVATTLTVLVALIALVALVGFKPVFGSGPNAD